MPSLNVLPPPNLHSSPYLVKSFSTRTSKSVSPRRTRSPVVGPYIVMYLAREIVAGGNAIGGLGLWTCLNPPAATLDMMPATSATPGAPGPSTRLFPPRTILLPAIGTRGTCLDSPGSNLTAVPAGTFRRMPIATARSNDSNPFVSVKW